MKYMNKLPAEVGPNHMLRSADQASTLPLLSLDSSRNASCLDLLLTSKYGFSPILTAL